MSEPRSAPRRRKQVETSRAEKRDPSFATISYAFSLLEGGKDEGIYYARMAAGNPDNQYSEQLRAVVDAYWALSEFDRRISTIDDLCIEAGIRPSRFFAETISEMREYKMNVSQVVAIRAHVDAVQSLARMATKDTDIDAKKMLFQHSNFLPQPKGSVVNYYNSVNSQTAIVANEKAGLPSFEDGVVATSNALRANSIDSPALPPYVQPEGHQSESE